MTTSDDDKKKGLSRRSMFGAAAVAAAAIPAFSAARAQPAGRGEGGPINSTSLGGGLPPQGGTGPIKVLFISSYHAFDRENLFRCWDRMGTDISWTPCRASRCRALLRSGAGRGLRRLPAV